MTLSPTVQTKLLLIICSIISQSWCLQHQQNLRHRPSATASTSCVGCRIPALREGMSCNMLRWQRGRMASYQWEGDVGTTALLVPFTKLCHHQPVGPRHHTVILIILICPVQGNQLCWIGWEGNTFFQTLIVNFCTRLTTTNIILKGFKGVFQYLEVSVGCLVDAPLIQISIVHSWRRNLTAVNKQPRHCHFHRDSVNGQGLREIVASPWPRINYHYLYSLSNTHRKISLRRNSSAARTQLCSTMLGQTKLEFAPRFHQTKQLQSPSSAKLLYCRLSTAVNPAVCKALPPDRSTESALPNCRLKLLKADLTGPLPLWGPSCWRTAIGTRGSTAHQWD